MKGNRSYSRRAATFVSALLTAATLATQLYPAVSAQRKSECPVRVTILQVNDVYQFSPVDSGKSGGLARVLTLRKKIMSESPNTLFLFSGDTISPSIESNTKQDGQALQGRQMIEAWNLAGLITLPSATTSLISVPAFCLNASANRTLSGWAQMSLTGKPANSLPAPSVRSAGISRRKDWHLWPSAA